MTRGKQWISVDSFDLMDMPGVLWKKFDSLETASNLAFIGSIRDDILDIEELACGLLSSVRGIYPQQLLARYKLDAEALTLPPYDLLQAIGAKRGMLISGGEVDTERAAKMLVGEFRASKWGRLSLERPPRRAIQEDREEVTDDAPQDDDLGRRTVTRPSTPLTPPDAPNTVLSAAWTRRAAARCAARSAVRRSS
mgnify:FL=1